LRHRRNGPPQRLRRKQISIGRSEPERHGHNVGVHIAIDVGTELRIVLVNRRRKLERQR
jgi:hypothetical protein